MCAKRNCSNSTPNGQNAQQLNNQDPTTWPPCERCGAGAPLKTQFGDLCDECGKNGDRPELGHDLIRPASWGDRCYECGAKPAGNVIERRITAGEIRFYCEFCLLPETEPIPYRITGLCSDEQRLMLFCEPDDQLCAIMAANSGRDGDKVLLKAASAELTRRTELQQALNELEQGVSHG